MRKLYHLFLLVGGGLLLAGNFTGCSSDGTSDDPVGPNDPDEPQISVSLTNNAPETTSVVLNLETSGISEYAWSVSEGNVTTLPKPEIVFANAQENGQRAEAKDGVNTIEVKGLNGNTEYTVFVATKSSEGYDVKDVHFTTADYTQIVTVTDVKQFSMTFHVKLDADKYFRWALCPYDTYLDMKAQMMHTDADFLAYNGGLTGQGEQTITVIDGKMADGSDPVDEWDDPMSFKVGAAYVLLLGECDAEGNLLYDIVGGGGGDIGGWDDDDNWGVLSTPMTRSFPDSCIGEYSETCEDDIIAWTGAYARQRLWAAPATPGKGEVEATPTTQTSRRVIFHLKPTADMVCYAALHMPASDWQNYVELYGETGAGALLTKEVMPETGEIDYEADGLTVGEQYSLVILSAFSQDYSVQNLQVIPFTAKESTMKVPVVEVKGIEAPADAEPTGPYYVWFNIKAPNKDLASAKYSCAYTKEWVKTLNGGETSLNALFDRYGVPMTDDIIASINSDAGFNMEFSSWENTESRLYIQAFNTDEVAEIYWGASTAPEEQPKERVESSLFNDLLGDWTAVYKNDKAKNGTKFKVTIAAAPEKPASMTAAEKQQLITYWTDVMGKTPAEAEERVANDFADYQARAQRFGEKYREQNRLVCRGLEYYDTANTNFSYYELGYYSPWTLFTDISYSAYSTDDLFYDYGSKWFIEIGKDTDGKDILKVATNPNYIAPVQFIDDKEYHLGLPISGNFYSYGAIDWPVTVSDDKDTITISGVSDESSNVYYPSLIYVKSGFVQSSASGTDGIVLTRGWEEPSVSQQSARRIELPKVQNGVNSHFKRTKLPYAGELKPCRKVSAQPVTKFSLDERVVARMQRK